MVFPDESGKRYRTYDRWCKDTFGCKVVKIPLDGGFTCPNRDGTKGFGGCTFCSGGGAEGIAADGRRAQLREQYKEGRARLEKKWGRAKTVAYFQSNTSTYAPLSRLKELYEEALTFEDVRALTIATRADALPKDVLDYLSELNTRTVLTVELGLQSVFDETAERIRRGHSFGEFLRGYEALKEREIAVCVHLIDGLPEETSAMMLESARRVASLSPEFVKFHELYIRRGSRMEEAYLKGEVPLLSREEYVEILADQIELLPPSVVVERVTGDPLRALAVAPAWALDKKKTVAALDKTLAARGAYQGFCAK